MGGRLREFRLYCLHLVYNVSSIINGEEEEEEEEIQKRALILKLQDAL